MALIPIACSFMLYRLCHLVILYLNQHAHTLHHLESLLTISLDRLDIFEGRSCISEFFEHEHVVMNPILAGMRHHHLHLMYLEIKQLAIKQILRISLTGFPAQSVGSFNTDVLDLPCLLVLITGTSQSRQHVDTSLIHIESHKSPTTVLFDDDTGRISIRHVLLRVSMHPAWSASEKAVSLKPEPFEYQSPMLMMKVVLHGVAADDDGGSSWLDKVMRRRRWCGVVAVEMADDRRC
ncbi:hypothetical protein Tco_0652821 [Tanacetum coccineum]|uniref:Uncharacterized protein n=1 Tax=Tanacetum coccineum TaxID=301880 RepID=A0ABQ4WYP6_9ASTR